jgi:hypothetical protein
MSGIEAFYHDFKKVDNEWFINIYFSGFQNPGFYFDKESLEKFIEQLQYILNDKTFDELK